VTCSGNSRQIVVDHRSCYSRCGYVQTFVVHAVPSRQPSKGAVGTTAQLSRDRNNTVPTLPPLLPVVPVMGMNSVQPHQDARNCAQVPVCPPVQSRPDVPPVVEQQEQELLQGGILQDDADMHDIEAAASDAMDDDTERPAAECNNAPQLNTTAKLQSSQGLSTQLGAQSALVTARHREESSAELPMPSGEPRVVQHPGRAPNNRKRRGNSTAESQPSSASDARRGATSGRRGASVSSRQGRSGSLAQPEVETNGKSNQPEVSTEQHSSQVEQGNAKGSGQHARNKRRATTGVLSNGFFL
jgi:hypothetical protein